MGGRGGGGSDLGATGKAKKWVLNTLVGSRGPLNNVELWKELLKEIVSPHRTMKWIKVPSHMGIQGNKEADSLAEDGRLSSSLLRQSVAPQARSLCRSLAPQRGNGLPPRLEPILISDCLTDVGMCHLPFLHPVTTHLHTAILICLYTSTKSLHP